MKPVTTPSAITHEEFLELIAKKLKDLEDKLDELLSSKSTAL